MSIIDEDEFTECYPERPTVYADELSNAAELLIDHPLAGRPWRIVGPADEPGFYHLEAIVSLVYNTDECRAEYTRCELCLHEEHFQRIG